MSGNEIHVQMDRGMSITAVRCHHGGHLSMTSFIKRSKDKIREALRSMSHLV